MDKIKEKYQIVIARYNEDIRWLLPFKDITIIYNKGNHDIILNKFQTIYLENVGRESHTYLYHIINNYDNLADKTLFFQGTIHDHKMLEIEDYLKDDDFIAKFDMIEIDKLKKNIDHFGKYRNDYNNGNMLKCNMTPFDFLTKIFGVVVEENISKVVWGANFSISKKLIQSRPISFYKNILRFIDYHPNPELGHYLERTWYFIFNNRFIEKKKLEYLFVKDYKKIPLLVEQYKDKIRDGNLHIWAPILANFEYGNYYKIVYTMCNNKYLAIKPKINEGGSFYIDVKGTNDATVMIEFENTEDKYEIALGGWGNTRSIIRDYNKNNIVCAFDKEILDKNKFIRFWFNVGERVSVSRENETILDIENIFEYQNNPIKRIKIKSYFGSDAYWNYDFDGTELHMANNIYDNIKIFYNNNYLDHYVEKI